MSVTLVRETWMPVELAEARGVDLSMVADSIGPRRAGTLYYGAYWRDMNQVIGVFVRVETGRTDGRAVATSWQVTEYSIGETRMRNHMTSWTYDRGNRMHHGPGDMRRAQHVCD